MRLSTLLPIAASTFLAYANADIFPPILPNPFPPGPVGSIVSTALATAPIPSAVAPAVASAVAAAPSTPNNASTDTIPGLAIPPAELYDNILGCIAILDVVLTLLNSSGLADVQIVDTRDLDLPISGLSALSLGGSLGGTITTLIGVAVPLLNLA